MRSSAGARKTTTRLPISNASAANPCDRNRLTSASQTHSSSSTMAISGGSVVFASNFMVFTTVSLLIRSPALYVRMIRLMPSAASFHASRQSKAAEVAGFITAGVTAAAVLLICQPAASPHPPSPMNLSNWPSITEKTLAIVMGGGAGNRLYPLTKERSKPAVPFAGKYRIVDIPISNCINSGLRRVYVLTQFNSTSLHRHIHSTYRFDRFSRGFVEILAAQQTPAASNGTRARPTPCARTCATSWAETSRLRADPLRATSSTASISQAMLGGTSRRARTSPSPTMPVGPAEISRLGILQADSDQPHRALRGEAQDRGGAVPSSASRPTCSATGPRRHRRRLYLASMGIYIFNRDKLVEALDNDFTSISAST